MVRTVIEVDWIPTDVNDKRKGKFVVRSLFKQQSITYTDNLKELREIINFYEKERDSNDTLSFVTTERFRERTNYNSIGDMLNN